MATAPRVKLPAARGTSPAPQRDPASWLVLGSSFLLYFFTFPVKSDGLLLGNDVVPYAVQLVEQGSQGLWNPHHLLFHPLAYVTTLFWSTITFSVPDLRAALAGHQLLSAAGGALSVLAMYQLARQLCRHRPALAFTGIYALASGTWLYSAVGETYMPANAILALLLLRSIELRIDLRHSSPVILGALLYLAVLLRQDSVLIVPVLWFLLPRKYWFATVLGAGMLSLGMHGIAWLLARPGVDFLGWLRGLEATGLWGGAFRFENLWVALLSTSNSLNFAGFESPFWGVLSLGLLVGVMVEPRKVNERGVAVRRALLVYFLLRFFFFAWWQPSNMEYFTGSLFPLVALAVVMWNPALDGRARTLRGAMLSSCLLVVGCGTLFSVVVPTRGDEMAERAGAALEQAGKGGSVVTLDRFQHYAVLRESPLDRNVVLAADAVSGGTEDNAALEALENQVTKALGAGHTVVLAADVVLVELWGLESWPVKDDALARLTSGREFETLRGADGRMWAIVMKAQ